MIDLDAFRLFFIEIHHHLWEGGVGFCAPKSSAQQESPDNDAPYPGHPAKKNSYLRCDFQFSHLCFSLFLVVLSSFYFSFLFFSFRFLSFIFFSFSFFSFCSLPVYDSPFRSALFCLGCSAACTEIVFSRVKNDSSQSKKRGPFVFFSFEKSHAK